MLNWLMIVCISSPFASEAPYCTSSGSGHGGGISTIMVTEVQCRAMLAQIGYQRNTYVRCVSPSGEVLHGKWRAQ